MKSHEPSRNSPWPHRVAVVLAWMVFPLIWIGGLVTTSDAGMAVPDWPNTYNYNMFAYPIRDWFLGPWDLFVEHGHRLLATWSGIVAIGLCAVTWIQDRRPLARWWALGILLLIIFQGILGGQRVVLDQRTLALVHGCLGPLFFATVVVMVVLTSRWWLDRSARLLDVRYNSTQAVMLASLVLVLLSYGQLILGACLRHIPDDADPNVYAAILITHLTTAFVIAILAVVNAYFVERPNWREGGVRPVSRAIVVMIVLQLVLGATTYVVKFGWPSWMGGYPYAAEYVIAEKSFWQTNLVTMHVALGSLILAMSAYQFVRVSRTIYLSESKSVSASAKLELAGA